MTTLNLTGITADTFNSLNVTPYPSGNAISWNQPAYNYNSLTEIWASQTNDRNDAILVGETPGTRWFDGCNPGETWYYWVRSRSVFGRTDGAWHPVAYNDGVAGTIPTIIDNINAGEITSNLLDSSIIVSTGSGNGGWSGCLVNSYNSWVECQVPVVNTNASHLTFTTPVTGKIVFGANLYAVLSSITTTASADFKVRFRLYNNGTSSDETPWTATKTFKVADINSSSTIVWFQPVVQFLTKSYDIGNSSGQLDPSTSYTMYVEFYKTRSGSDTFTATIDGELYYEFKNG